MSERKNYFLWIFFDFANSLAFINVSFYFSLWWVSEHGESDFWISLAAAFSTLLLLITLPYLGHVSDRSGKKLVFLRMFTLLTILAQGLMGFLALQTPFSKSLDVSVLIFYFLVLLFYQATLPFYNAFLRGFAEKRGSNAVAGMGLGFGQLGNILGILLVMPVVAQWGRASGFVAAAILFLIFSLPVLLFFKEPAHTETLEKETHYWTSLKKAAKIPGLLPFLLSYYFFADAILTLQLFLSLYLEEVGSMDDKQKALVVVLALVFACLGAWLASRFARLFSSTRSAIHVLIGSWAVLLGALSLVSSLLIFYPLVLLNGFAFGCLFSLSRAFYAEITPKNQQAELFSVYILCERAASILGPLLWSTVIFFFTPYGAIRYRVAMFSLALMIGVSFLIFRKVGTSENSISKITPGTTHKPL